jgi:hypothetical protein
MIATASSLTTSALSPPSLATKSFAVLKCSLAFSAFAGGLEEDAKILVNLSKPEPIPPVCIELSSSFELLQRLLCLANLELSRPDV